MQYKMAMHLAHFRKLHLRPGRYQLQNLILYRILPVGRIQGKKRLRTNGACFSAPQKSQKLPVNPLPLLRQQHPQIQLGQLGKEIRIEFLYQILLVLVIGKPGQAFHLTMDIFQVSQGNSGRPGTVQHFAECRKAIRKIYTFQGLLPFLSPLQLILLRIKLYQFIFIQHFISRSRPLPSRRGPLRQPVFFSYLSTNDIIIKHFSFPGKYGIFPSLLYPDRISGKMDSKQQKP